MAHSETIGNSADEGGSSEPPGPSADGLRLGDLPVHANRRWMRVAEVLAQNWIIVALGAIAGLVLGGVVGQTPPRYTSEALLTLAQASTVASFEPSITTTTAGTLPNGPERRQAIADLIVNAAVERDAINRLASTLPGARFQPGELVGAIQGSIRTTSDVISIRATQPTAAESIAVVNAWAESYVSFVNLLYLSGGSVQLNGLIAQRDAAARQLDEAQGALESSLQNSRVEMLTDTLTRDQQELSALRAPSPDNRTPSDSYELVQLQTVNNLADTLRRIDVAEQSARTISVGGGASGDPQNSTSEAAVAVIKAQVVSILGGLPSSVQISVPLGSGAPRPDDLNGLIAHLRNAREQVAKELATQRAAYETMVNERAVALDNDMQDLRAQLELASAERAALNARRDLALSTYTALAKKVQEQQIQQADAGREVSLASRANSASLLPRSTALPRTLGTLLGALAALLLAVVTRGMAARLQPQSARYVRSEGAG